MGDRMVGGTGEDHAQCGHCMAGECLSGRFF